MSSTAKHNVSYYFLLSILLIGAIIILYAGVYGVWALYNNHLFNTRGYDTTATIIKKENGFMDCLESLEFLLSDEGKAAIVQLHVEGIIDYVRSCSEE